MNEETNQAAEQPKQDAIENTVSDYSDVQIQETEYLYFPWFVRGKLTAIQGDTDTGKSTFLYTIGAYVSQGKPIFGIQCEAPGNVMFVTLEDSESDIKTAFQDAGGDMSKLRRIRDRKMIARMQLTDPNVLKYIEQIIIKKKLAFIVFDPIQAYLGGDINQASVTRPQMAALAEIAERTNCCIVFIQHTGKDTMRRGIHRGLGSVDIVAASRSLLQVSLDPEDEAFRIAYTLKNNTASKLYTEEAIRYTIKDHPGAVDTITGKHHHYHGHAELSSVINRYTEQIHRAKVEANKAKAGEEQAELTYDSDQLVLTLRELATQNPERFFIGYKELIRCIRDRGKCPYFTGKGKGSLTDRLSKIREMLQDKDGIVIDPTDNAIQQKPYQWNGERIENYVTDEEGKRERGIFIEKIEKA